MDKRNMELHRILCCGDSNTYGYDPRSYLGGRYPKSVRWTALLETDGWSILNDGQNGRCIPQREWEIAAVVQKIHRSKAEIVITMLGSNDLLQRPDLGAKACTKRMKDFLVALLQRSTSSFKTLLVAPPPMVPGAWVADDKLLTESLRLADCYERLAQQIGIGFANAGAWDIELAYDGVHFTEQGHRNFYREISKILKAAI